MPSIYSAPGLEPTNDQFIHALWEDRAFILAELETGRVGSMPPTRCSGVIRDKATLLRTKALNAKLPNDLIVGHQGVLPT